MCANDDLLGRNPPVIGASGMLHAPGVLDVYAEEGLDYVFLDFEHNGESIWNSMLLEDIVRATEHTGLEPIVRIPSGEPTMLGGLVRKVLDSGIRNIVVPRVRHTEEVRTLAHASKFEFEGGPGGRGVGAGRGSRWGSKIDRGWFEAEDETANLGIMVENVDSVDNMDEICAVDGLEFALIGSMDLTIDLGAPGETESVAFEDAIDTVVEACDAHDVPFGQLGTSLEGGLEMVDRGATFLHLGSDVAFIRSSLDDRLEALE